MDSLKKCDTNTNNIILEAQTEINKRFDDLVITVSNLHEQNSNFVENIENEMTKLDQTLYDYDKRLLCYKSEQDQELNSHKDELILVRSENKKILTLIRSISDHITNNSDYMAECIKIFNELKNGHSALLEEFSNIKNIESEILSVPDKINEMNERIELFDDCSDELKTFSKLLKEYEILVSQNALKFKSFDTFATTVGYRLNRLEEMIEGENEKCQ